LFIWGYKEQSLASKIRHMVWVALQNIDER